MGRFDASGTSKNDNSPKVCTMWGFAVVIVEGQQCTYIMAERTRPGIRLCEGFK